MDKIFVKLKTWRSKVTNKGLRVKMSKTKLMISGLNLGVLKKSEKYFCGVCGNVNYCGSCRQWVHKKCSSIKSFFASDLDFKCALCLGAARSVDGRLVKEVMVGDESLEVVLEFCYFGDMLSAGSGCELASKARCKCAWGKFFQLKLISCLVNNNFTYVGSSVQKLTTILHV